LVNSGRHDFAPSNLLVSTMVGLNDPRVPLYFTKDQNGGYSGGVPGSANNYGSFSDFTPAIQVPAYKGDFLDYEKVEFLLAEAAARGFAGFSDPATHYNSAITASITFWGGSAGDAATYLLQPSVAYSNVATTWQQKIGYQQWIANFNNNWDSWTDIRRYGYPNLDVVNPPAGANGKLPIRFAYPNSEQTANSVNWSAAAKKLPGGIDAVSAKLWWEK